MITSQDLDSVRDEDAFVHYANRYWPRWFRNTMACGLMRIQAPTGPNLPLNVQQAIESLLSRLLAPTNVCRDLSPDDKQIVVRLFSVFRARQLPRLASNGHDMLAIDGSAGAFPYEIGYADDMFATPRHLTTPIHDMLEQAFADVGIEATWSTLRGCDRPLKLYAPDERLLNALMMRIHPRFHMFCEFAIDDVGLVRLDLGRRETIETYQSEPGDAGSL